MKRKFHITNIEIVLPQSQKRVKIEELSIKFKERMSEQEFKELEQLLNNDRQKYSPNQEQDNNHLIYDSDSESTYSDKSTVKDSDNDDQEILSEKSDIISILDESENTETSGEIVRTPHPNDQWDEKAKELSQMNKYCKGEQQEKWIKDQLETYGFTVTKTQSTFEKEIIGDNGIDHLFQIKINNQVI